MDPVATALAVYLNAATQAFDHMDLELTTESIQYQGFQITFAHQTWKIRDASVCQGYNGDVIRLSECTQAARQLFAEMCQALQDRPPRDLDARSIKKMYCTAAASYRPTQASVEWAEPTTPEADARQACRMARAALLTSNTPENRYRKKKACQQPDPN